MGFRVKIEPQTFTGVSGEIPAHLFTHAETTHKLAVVLPGAGYTYVEPLLRYGIQVLLKNNYRVLALDKIYGHDPKWRSLSSEQEARSIVEQDTVQIFRQIEERFPNSLELLFGRSLGTFAMACLLEQNLVNPKKIVWQTPALGSKWEIMRDCKIPGFGILGTADHYYQKAIEFLPNSRIVIDGADHGMEIPGEPVQSIEILKRVTLATEEWIAQ